MQKLKSTLEVIVKLKEVVVFISALTLWVLALWFTSKLTPVVQDIQSLDYRISANENDINNFSTDITTIKTDVGYIRGVLSDK